MKTRVTFALILSFSLSASLSACSETPTEQRERLNKVADEIIASGSQEAMQARMGKLSEEDMEVFSSILQERMTAAENAVAGGSALTQRLIQYAAEDKERADRLVAECEMDTGASATGGEARKVAECVDQRW